MAEVLPMHQMVYLALFIAIVAVVLGGLGTKAYFDNNVNEDDDHVMGNLRVKNTLTVDKNTFNNGSVRNLSSVTTNGLTKLDGGLADLYKNGTSAKTTNFTAEAGYIYLITKTDGCAVTLPKPSIGDRIKLVFGAVTSNNHTVTTDAATTLYGGYLLLADTADGTNTEHKVFAPDGTNDRVITMNGTTTGVSGVIELVATQNITWSVSGTLMASGVTIVTPFS